MAASEIDDIFAHKPTVTKDPKPSPSSSTLPPEKKKKSKAAKRKREQPTEDAAPPTKRRAPETILDPSAHLSAVAPQKTPAAKVQKSTAGSIAKKKKSSEKHKEDEERFKDSRGTGPRRKTEEGFSIYKEDELGITDQGGDTPLCPFDCQCCF